MINWLSTVADFFIDSSSVVISNWSSTTTDFATFKITVLSESLEEPESSKDCFDFFVILMPVEPNPSTARFVFPNIIGSDTFSKVTLYFFM